MKNRLLTQNEMSERTIKNIIVSGNINFQRRKNDGKQVVISSSNSNNPLKVYHKSNIYLKNMRKKQAQVPQEKPIWEIQSEQTPKL